MDESETVAAAPKADPIADFVDKLSAALDAGDTEQVKVLASGLRTPDLADVIELLADDERVQLIETLGNDLDYEVFSQLDEAVRDQLSEALPNTLLAKAVTELDTDDAAYLIESLEESDRQEIFDQLSFDDRSALERNFEYEEETAGRLMQSDFVAVAPFWSVGRVIDYMRETDDLPDTFSEIFVVDPAFRVLGSVELSRLLRTKRQVLVEEIMNPDRHVVLATEDQEEVARQFARYDLMSAPVIDENERLVGVVTIDDVVDVIQEEAEDDMHALGGVGDESIADSVLSTVRSRIPWLMVNLGTAMLSPLVIQNFDATIEQMVALAVMMPVVSAMGGNAGTQTMTVTVRALATNKLGRVNAPRVITREALVGVVNGLVLSSIMALVAFLWFGSGLLGGVIAAAMIVNLLVAALAGILIPLTLSWLKFDPAPSSGVFVTTLTDVVGFFAFLGLASLWLS
ncbi:Magnesium transporter [Candidatus Filomicrobium marinum]|uniref:Magnesium transporter MgtE n=2 Tax=Filomicrobium TaxID=119044 RepID=A0A0D6JBH8_9HYPH|nr:MULTISPECIES: magnesium transporter [Filomicrobium]MCV0371150.1 magnesium transporter [Filomicrobium sp.]CFX02975.1 Magnesium transporter [Candidatus Filomicrobium marinum]CPR15756.1 Magnesium transporter [Candidatus Filomicrobium marinum]SDP38624.1 magnesium transporter [Filomicrobium insigne]